MLILPKSSSRNGSFTAMVGLSRVCPFSGSFSLTLPCCDSRRSQVTLKLTLGWWKLGKIFCFDFFTKFSVRNFTKNIYSVLSVVSGCNLLAPGPPQRGPGMAGGATGATVPPTAAEAAAFCFSIVQSKV